MKPLKIAILSLGKRGSNRDYVLRRHEILNGTRWEMKKKAKGKIIVTPIPQDLMDDFRKLPDKKYRSIEETGKFAAEVFKRCFRYEGDPVDVSKLPKDYDEDELNYDPSTVYKPRLRKTSKKRRNTY